MNYAFSSAMYATPRSTGPSITATNAAADAREARSETRAMAADIERLFMITESLWNIIKEELGYTDEELTRRMEDVDLKDGRLDGRVARQPNPECPKCHRVLIGNHPVCLYCGTAVIREPFER